MSEQITIVYMADASPVEGKANLDIFEPFKSLADKGMEIHLLLRNEEAGEYNWPTQSSITVHPIYPNPPYSYFYAPVSLYRSFQLLRDIQPDILVTGGDQVVPLIGQAIEMWKGLPRIVVLRAMPLEYIAKNNDSLLYRFVASVLYRLNDRVIKQTPTLLSISGGIKKFYEQKLERTDIENLQLLCLDTSKYKVTNKNKRRFIREYDLDPEEVFITYTGVFNNRNIDKLMQVFADVHKNNSQTTLLLAGYVFDEQTNKKALVREFIEDYDLKIGDDVVLFDWLDKDEIPTLLSVSDICVDPDTRQYPHSFAPSNKLLEWLSAGRPAIVADVPGHAVLIDNQVNGFLYEPGNYTLLREYIMRLVRDPQLRTRIGNEARKTSKKFDVKNVAPKLYDKLRAESVN